MGEVLSLKAGTFISALDIHSEESYEFPYPCFGGNGIRGYSARANSEGDYVLIGRQGAWSGNVQRATGKFHATEHAIVVTPMTELNTSWLYHELKWMNLNQYVSAGAQPGLAVGNLNRLLLPVPTIEEQNRIAKILDRFELLTKDLNVGLPAELAARRKQYEYYRDRLLTFDELVA